MSALAGSPACAPIRNYAELSGPRYAGGPVHATASAGLRVVTFNIKFSREIDKAIELLRTSAPLRQADVLALQEMDAEGVERIATALGLAYVYYPAAVHPSGGRDFGNAVLVRGQIEEDHKVVLPHPGRFGGMQRIAVAVTARIAGRSVRVYSVHLGTPKDLAASASARRNQVAAILEDARSAPGPVVVAGDFNNRSVSATAFERAGFTWLTRDVGRTVSLFSWDHVFVRGLPADSAAHGRSVDSRGASDHRAVWVELGNLSTAPLRETPPIQ